MLVKIADIDRGGFGVVDLVENVNGERMARKTFDPQLGNRVEIELLRKRFSREVRIQSLIRHPNVMPVLHAALDDEPPWFTMPLATETYEGKLATDKATGVFDPLPWADILAAVEELHRLGYVHRDLKPANILMVDGRWVLSDFGLVLPTMRDTTVLTGTNAAYGSRHYAAPEQAVDFRNTPPEADIFALGCVLHDASDPGAARVPFSQIHTAGPLSVVLERATELDYRRRFRSVTDLRAALFDVWAAPATAIADTDSIDLVDVVQTDPANLDGWRRLLQELEKSESSRDPLLRRVSAQMILELAARDEVLFSRLVTLLCEWASGNSFEWEYCDVVGDRLVEAYRVSAVRLKAAIVLAALDLGGSHNRWHVMRQAAGMLGLAADNGLVDRILIEMSLDHNVEFRLRQVEAIISYPRQHWHERIAARLSENDKRPKAAPMPTVEL